jgi:predicted RND superfamily exporter protein
VILGILSVFALPHLKFAFNFEQFFPVGDEDLEYFQDFIAEFESDDNFLLIAVKNEPSVFDTSFLKTIDSLTEDCRSVSYVKDVQSITTFKYPTVTPFGPGALDAVHLDSPDKLLQDSIRLLSDERIVYNLLNETGDATVILLKTIEDTQIDECNQIMDEVNALLQKYDLPNHHLLGRAYFQSELSELQFREILISTIVSGILISIVMILIFRKWRSILIALGSIGVGLLIFMGVLSVLGRELTLMAALYPILMLIVGTSDVVHIMTKYFDELKKGLVKKEAIKITIKQIGMATLLTSLTTAAGFATLLTSRVIPIKDFGINSAIGVIIAYVVVIGVTCPLMTFFKKEDLIAVNKKDKYWGKWLSKSYEATLKHTRKIVIASTIFLIACLYGLTLIHTNYDLATNLPRGAKITEDFNFFEEQFAGFRPLELATYIQEGRSYLDYEVMDAVARTEDFIKSQDEINTTLSPATLARSLNQALHSNDYNYYKMPDTTVYNQSKGILTVISATNANMLINKNKDKLRISTRVKDIGADNVKLLSARIDNWIAENIDSSVVQFKQTGTGLILDKNSQFVKESLLYGLGLALVIVSLLMGMLFRDFKVLFIALVPNVIPLLFAAALIGYLGIALEAGVSIVFAIIFGIAVDDTIHFMSKYKLAKDQYGDREKALQVTFQETGKAIIFTSIILFCGFMIMLFSANLPSVIIGLLISVTLLSALIADLFLLPVILRWFDI